MSNKRQLPEPLQEALNTFFTDHENKDLENSIDNITQYAILFLDTQASAQCGDYFFLMRNIKLLLKALKPFAHE